MDNYNNDDDMNDGQDPEDQINQLMQERYSIPGLDYILDVPLDMYNEIVKTWNASRDYANLVQWESLMELESRGIGLVQEKIVYTPDEADAFKTQIEERRAEEQRYRMNLCQNYAIAKQSASAEIDRIIKKVKAASKKKKK